MANTAFVVNQARMHRGPGWAWFNPVRPGAGARLLIDGSNPPQLVIPTQAWAATTAYVLDQQVIDSNNNLQQCVSPGTSGSTVPTWSTALFGLTTDATVQWQNLGPYNTPLGGTEADITVKVQGKGDPVNYDQFPAPVDAIMTAETAEVDMTLAESSLDKVVRGMIHGTFTSGTDAGLPTGAQAYEMISGGGLQVIPKPAIAVVSPQRQFSAPTKNYVFCLYKAYVKDAFQLPFTRTKEAKWKVTFEGMAVTSRAVGDQVWQLYRQT